MPTDLELRQARRDALLHLVRRERVRDQAELVRRLREHGVEATQSSVSRDLRELGVFKMGGRYVLPESGTPARDLDDVAHFLRAVRPAGPHLTVVLTTSGAAQTVALALDRSGWPEALGTVAGDDTVFLATAGQRAQTRVLHRLERLLVSSQEPSVSQEFSR